MANRYTFDALCQAGHFSAISIGSSSHLMAYVDDDVTGLPVGGLSVGVTPKDGVFAPTVGTTAADGYYVFTHAPISPVEVWTAALYVPPPRTGLNLRATYDVDFRGSVAADYAPKTSLVASKGDTIALLSWTAAVVCDPRGVVTGYDVQRSLAANMSSPVTIASNINQLSFLDTGLNNATSYWYRVTARWQLPGNWRTGTGLFLGNSNVAQLRAVRESWGMLATHRL